MSDSPTSRARAALSRGDVLIAYDEASRALDERPDDLDAQYLAALALARAGVPERARIAAEALVSSIEKGDSDAVPVALLGEAEALVARIAKDDALAAAAEDRSRLLERAARLYEGVAQRHGGYYALINAATLFLLAGKDRRARSLAASARTMAAAATAESPDEYWAIATEAEAALVVGDVPSAEVAINRAAQLGASDIAARAATRRQLRLVCDTRGIDPGVLEALTLPGVMHFCGHRRVDDSTQHFPSRLQDQVASEVRGFLDRRPIGFAFGSLASGADIVVAEVLLDEGVELNVVLPFAVEEFVAVSVAPAGEDWVDRFHACLSHASQVVVASDSRYEQFDELFSYAGCVAMGHALNYASFLDAVPVQLAVWDGVASLGPAGTAHDVEIWSRTGNSAHIVSVPPVAQGRAPRVAARPGQAREIRAILFSDFRGFSRLMDEQFPAFLDCALGRLAAVLNRHAPNVLWCNTRGDGIAAVCADVLTAASCALGFHEAMAGVDLEAFGLPNDLSLRIGAHVGPVMAIRDPVVDEIAYWGREITRAARIEPRTPEGEVYVTDAFAALLALERDAPFGAEYVGRMTTAKDFETIPMFRLRRLGPQPVVATA